MDTTEKMDISSSDNMVRTFGVADYVIFTMSLFLSLFIGVFSGTMDWAMLKLERVGALRSASGLKEQLLGGQDMKPLPVALSLLASFLSAPFLLGTPAEIYSYGTMYSAILIGYLLACPVTAHFFVPVFHRQQLTSAYEFIEKRFNGGIRIAGSLMFSFMMILYMAVVIYAPAAAFAQVTGLPTIASILGVGVICTMYTAFGGMKAVVWTDAVQMVIIFAGMLALIIEGTRDAGGPAKVWERAVEGGRIQTDALSLDPTARHTWWTQSIGGFFVTLSVTATNQAMIQRYLSIKTTKDAQKAVYYSLLFQELYLGLVIILGLVMYAYYYHCDPVITDRIASRDQLVPIFVMDSLGDVYGLPGLFSASVFSASLSTVSSGVNALAAVVISDIIHPLYKRNKLKKMSDLHSARLSKGLSVVFGFATVALAFLAPFLGTTLLQIAMTIFGLVGGPLLGLFILAIFFPMANEWGGLVGMLTSLIFTGWISIGNIMYPKYPVPLPLRADRCPFPTNATHVIPPPKPDEGFDVTDIYGLSYMWYAALSVVVALIVGLPVSFCTGGNKDKENVDTSLFFAYHRKCTPCFNACHCERCFPIEDTEDVEEIHNYQMQNSEKRFSVDSVFGMYHEDPAMKRTSIAIQYGPDGSISEHFRHKAPPTVFAISHGAETLGEITEEEDEEAVVMESEGGGWANPTFSTFGEEAVEETGQQNGGVEMGDGRRRWNRRKTHAEIDVHHLGNGILKEGGGEVSTAL